MIIAHIALEAQLDKIFHYVIDKNDTGEILHLWCRFLEYIYELLCNKFCME